MSVKSISSRPLPALALAAILLMCIVSCASQIRPDQVLMKNPGNENPLVEKYNMKIAAGGLRNPAGPGLSKDYRIGPEDLLDVSVFEVKEMTSEVRVNGNGYIRLPLAGQIKAGGLTSTQLENLIAKRLDRYLQEPTVSVFIKEYRSQPISVLGAVKSPKIYYVTGQMCLLDVLSMAGGLTADAGNVCIVQNATGKAPRKQTVVNLEQLLSKGHTELNIPIHSGDIVNVPTGGVFFVDGAVSAPGSFPLKGETTVTQAISMAKGLSFEAVKSDIKIYRDAGAGRKVIAVNYDSILAGKSKDIRLRDKDIVIVPKSGFKSFVKGITTYIGLGPFGLGRSGL